MICGAYFGDKMTPLSETTILVPKLVGGGLRPGSTCGTCSGRPGPALGISLVIFLVLGLNATPDGAISTDEARRVLGDAFNITALNLLPLAAARRVHGEEGAAVPGDPRLGALRRDPRVLHAVDAT